MTHESKNSEVGGRLAVANVGVNTDSIVSSVIATLTLEIMAT